MNKKVVYIVFAIVMLLTQRVVASEPSVWAIDDIEAVRASALIDEVYLTEYGENISRKTYGYIIYQLYEYLAGAPISDIINLSVEHGFIDTDDFYLVALKGAGIIEGYPDGTYHPSDSITREEIMSLYVRVLEEVGYTLELPDKSFADEKQISVWALEAVKKCYGVGLIEGVGNQAINPLGTATVEESLVIFNRVINNENFVPRSGIESLSPSALVSNGLVTYGLKYDLLGVPIGIELYSDYTFEKTIIEGLITTELYLADAQLYYGDETGNLVRYYKGKTTQYDYNIEKKRWVVKNEVLYCEEGKDLVAYDLGTTETRTRVNEGLKDIVGTTDIDLDLGILTIKADGLMIDHEVIDYTVVNGQLIYLKANGELIYYHIDSKVKVVYGNTDIIEIDRNWNYLIVTEEIKKNIMFTRYIPIYRIRTFLNL